MSDELYDEKTSIQVTVKLRDKLKALGQKGETYEEILWKLIENQKDNSG